MNIKAVIFDYGKVISLPPDPKVIDVLAERIGVEREKFEPLLWGLRDEYDRGAVTARAYYGEILSRLNVRMDDKDIDELLEIDWASWEHINPGTFALMEDVKKAGYILGILSNMPRDFLARARRRKTPAFLLPHVSLFSCEAGLVKPEKAIYEKMLSMTGVESGSLVFFDDRPDNVESAGELGIKAFIWKDSETARAELSALGVKL